jgi:Domain of unknown function (DUF1707)
VPPEGPAAPHIRASDEDRERVVTALTEHCAAGRLTLEELPDRVARAYRARTLRELAEITADLPGRVPPAAGVPAERPRKPPRLPGIAPFTETLVVDRPRAAVLTEALREIAPRLGSYGYELVGSAPDSLAFERSERPVWTIVVAIVIFPFGLLALTYQRTMRVQLSFEELGEDRTRLTAFGKAPLSVRRAFAELR